MSRYDPTDPAALARSAGIETVTILPAISTTERPRPQLHAVAVFMDEPVPHLSPFAGLTDYDQRLPLADHECDHGHLATDPHITCDCYELDRIRRAADRAALVDVDELDVVDELLELAATDRGGPHDAADLTIERSAA